MKRKFSKVVKVVFRPPRWSDPPDYSGMIATLSCGHTRDDIADPQLKKSVLCKVCSMESEKEQYDGKH